MIGLIFWGLLSALFFSSTFILNRVMSLEGGHWVWSASLRYGYMIGLLIIFLFLFKGGRVVTGAFRLFLSYWKFWIISGSIGFGGFYSLICFSADYVPGWVIATTWQLTIIATLFVLQCFGRSFPRKIWIFSFLIFVGVLLVNVTYAHSLDLKTLVLGGGPILVAAFCYPLGNQLVWETRKQSKLQWVPHIGDPLLENPFIKVLLLSLGTVPFWLLLLLLTSPPLPSSGQLINTALVAFFSGILATSIFLYARGKAEKASDLAAVDATQSAEVIFALLGEIILLAAPFPTYTALGGMSLVFIGLTLFICFQEKPG